MEKHWSVTPGPHFCSGRTTQGIMADVLIALIPVCAASAILFGWRALALQAFCVLLCVGIEALTQKLFHKKITVSDLSAAVTGLILACNLPSTLPFWMAAIGCLAAIVFAKQVFGGIGSNIANPAIVGRIVLMISFPSAMSSFPLPNFAPDGTASATTLAILRDGGTLPTLREMFLGVRAGCLGETCVLAILIGFVYLMVRRVIHPGAPIAFLLTYLGFSALAADRPFSSPVLLYQLMSGGLLFGAVFMVTDYPTAPRTLPGRIIFGFGVGLITFAIRTYGNLPEGVSFGILLMNMLTPMIDRLLPTRPFGWKKPKKNREKAVKAA